MLREHVFPSLVSAHPLSVAQIKDHQANQPQASKHFHASIHGMLQVPGSVCMKSDRHITCRIICSSGVLPFPSLASRYPYPTLEFKYLLCKYTYLELLECSFFSRQRDSSQAWIASPTNFPILPNISIGI